MKKTYTILMALMVLCFTQCKPNPEGGDDNAPKVRVSCEIPMNDGSKSDFTNLMANGKINWSNGRECVYLAIHGDNPQIIELEGYADGYPSKLEFTGEAAEGLIVSGEEYDIWYFGHSHQLETPYYNNDGESLTGSIANQSGRLSDLGYCHIAKTTVQAKTENGEVRLNLSGVFNHQIAIALLDLNNVTELYGDAIVGTEYALECTGGRYELNVVENNNAKINVESASGISYVVLLPNNKKEANVKIKRGGNTYAYTFHNGIKSNKVYYRTAIDGTTPEALTWSEIEDNETNGHEYVDLGLPSGLLWATCNVGANSPEEYGNYYAWGETTTKETYTEYNCATLEVAINNIAGNAQYDAATVNWGGDWRMPTRAEQQELLNNCTWTWTTQNGVKGYKVTSKVNSNYIFLPAAGYRYGSSLYYAGSGGYYWSSSPNVGYSYGAITLNFDSSNHSMFNGHRDYGRSVRPVCGGNFDGPAAQYAWVETSEITGITSNSAVLGGNVTTDNGSAVVAKGVCWSESPNPTIEDSSITMNGNGIGSFTSNITDLVPNTQYYVRAFAINAAGTSYGEEKSFTTLTAGPDANGHSYVDLGLSVKWATCNVGATSPEGYGNYYAWGDTATKETYDNDNFPTYSLNYSQLQSQGYIDGEGNLTAQYDAATANWGGDWRMPTETEMQELINNCTWTWTTQNGVNGYNVEGPNGNSIFLPAAGYRSRSSLYDAGSNGYFWSSTPPNGSNSYHAYSLNFNSFNPYMSNFFRSGGQSVRPVLE